MEMRLGDERITLRGSVEVPAARRTDRRASAGRVCAEEGCSTRLSVYNRATRCWQHEPAHRYLPVHGGRRSEDPTPPEDEILIAALSPR